MITFGVTLTKSSPRTTCVISKSRSSTALAVKNVALRTEPVTSTLYIDKRNDIWSTFIEPDPDKASQFNPLTIQVNSLDSLTKQMDLTDEMLVKIDTKGSDLEVTQ